jgi:hypothetical protein
MSHPVFCGESIVFYGEMRNLVPYSSSLSENPDEVPHCPRGNEEVYMFTGTGGKSALRHAAEREVFLRNRQFDPNFRESVLTRQMLSYGGVKGSGPSAHPDPRNIRRARLANPLVDDFGTGEPSFLGGCFYAGIAMTKTPVLGRKLSYGHWQFDVNTRHPALRKTLASSPDFNPDDLSDPEKLNQDRALNSIRSKVDNAIDGWKSLEGKQRKTPVLTKGDAAELAIHMQSLREHLGRKISTLEEARAARANFVKEMKADGTSDVSEGNPHSYPTVPAGTEWIVTHWLNSPRSIYSLGLLMAAMHRYHWQSPWVGGNRARGCGALFEGQYIVKRQNPETGELILDCVITFRPHRGIEFDDQNSLCATACNAWKSCDVRDFTWTFDGVRDMLRE